MTELEIIAKITLACLFGGLIGFTREFKGKAAGLRTHMMVCMGAALFTLISIYMSIIFEGVDAARIASTILIGIGFIGGGTIIREGGAVRGLTTAATIWVVAAIGMAVGCGMYVVATFTTLLSLVVLHLLSIVETKFISSSRR
jgi:putative Mg2+ transporter-C (MgtC) family protein